MPTSESLPPPIVDFLLSDAAQQAIAALTPRDLEPDQTIPTLNSLRQAFPPEKAGPLLTLARLRLRAEAKFPHARRMFFTAEALEQATSWTVALHRAEWIHRHAKPGPVLDLGCGIGGDTLALAHFRPVIAYEQDPARLAFARANARAVAPAQPIDFRCADWTAELAAGDLPAAAAAFADPSRRIDGRRIFSLHHMQPPLEALLALQAHTSNLAAKIMPGVDDAELPPACGVEFLSHEGVCKEAVLWFGDLAQHDRWASVHSDDSWHTLASAGAQPPVGPIHPGSVLYEPDPAVIRAGAFAELCELLNAHLVDPHIAYLVAADLRQTPFTSAFLVREVHPFNLRHLNQRLRALGINSVELKKRGAPFEPESLRSRLKLPRQGGAGVVLFTRLENAPIMIIAQRP